MFDFSLVVDQALKSQGCAPLTEEVYEDPMSPVSGGGGAMFGGLALAGPGALSPHPPHPPQPRRSHQHDVLDDETREKIVEKLIEKATNNVGDGPVSPLARHQIEHVQGVVQRKLTVASTASLAVSIQMIAESERILQALIPELSALCNYPRDEVDEWQFPLLRACKQVSEVLPKLQYGRRHSRGPSRQIVLTCNERLIASSEREVYRPISPRKSILSQPKSPLLESPTTDLGFDVGQEAKTPAELYKERLGIGVKQISTQTDWELDVGVDPPEVKQLKARLKELEREMGVLLREKRTADAQAEAARTSLRGRSRAVVEMRTGLYREVCMLKEQLTIQSQPGAYIQNDPHAIRPDALIDISDKDTATYDELARCKDQHAKEKALWAKELAYVHHRFRTALSDRLRVNEKKDGSSTITAEHLYGIQEVVEAVKGDFNTFGATIQQLLGDYQEALHDLSARQSTLASTIESLSVESNRSRHLQKLLTGVAALFTPLLTLHDGEHMEEGAHPWEPFGNVEDPLEDFLGGDDGVELIAKQKQQMQTLYSLASGFVFSAEVGRGGGGPSAGVSKKTEHGGNVARLLGLSGGRLRREADRILTKSDGFVSQVERTKVRIIIDRDIEYGALYAQSGFHLALRKILVRKVLKDIKTLEAKKAPEQQLARERNRVRRFDAKITYLIKRRRALKLERSAGPTEEEINQEIVPLVARRSVVPPEGRKSLAPRASVMMEPMSPVATPS